MIRESTAGYLPIRKRGSIGGERASVLELKKALRGILYKNFIEPLNKLAK